MTLGFVPALIAEALLVLAGVTGVLAALARPLPSSQRPELYGGGRAAERVCDVLGAYTPAP